MSIYQKIAAIGPKFLSKAKLFKIGFNLSPMYRRSTAKIDHVSADLMNVRVKLPISYKNRNYVNSIFGGSMFSAVDPIPMVQLMNLIGEDYVVWDKSAEIKFKRPANQNLFAEFVYTPEELENIKKRVAVENEIEIVKSTSLTNKEQTIEFCVVHKTLYIATKSFYKNKRKRKGQSPK